MFIIDNLNKITIIEGDSGSFDVAVQDYEFVEGDRLYLSVKGSGEEEYLFQKEITEFDGNVATLVINPEDTKGKVGVYMYDIQITLENGYVDTVIPPTKFTVKGGITNE